MSRFFKDRKKLFSDEEAAQARTESASGRIDWKMLVLSVIATLLFTFPGVFGLILTLIAWKARNSLMEMKCLFYGKLCSILAIVLGLGYIFFTSLPK